MTFVQGSSTTTNPFLPGFIDLQNEVLNFGFNDGPQVNRQRIKAWLNEAQHRIARQVEGPEFQSAYPLPMIVGTYSYQLPTDFLRMQDVYYSSLSYSLRPVDLKQIDMTSPALVQGPPEMYTLYQFNLVVFPSPAYADTLTLHYIQNPPDMILDTDVPQLNSNYYDLLITYAVLKGFEAEDDYEAAQYFKGKYDKDLDAYATDVQRRDVDRPRQVDGSWTGQRYGSRAV